MQELQIIPLEIIDPKPAGNELMKPTKVIKKSHFIVITMLSITITASAQLKVNNFGRVGIGNVSPNQNTCLVVGSNQYNSFGGSFSIQELKAELDELKGTDQFRQARSNEKSGTFEEDHTLYPISVNGQIIGKKRPVQK